MQFLILCLFTGHCKLIGINPNPDKPEPTLTVKTKKESKKIEFGTQELTKVKTKIS
jgi:hypothetical protein